MNEVYLVWGALVFGILTRAVAPYLIELYKANKNGEKLSWNWTYLRGQLILSGIVFLLLPYLIDDVAKVAEMTLQQAWAEGFAVAHAGRLLDKILPELFD